MSYGYSHGNNFGHQSQNQDTYYDPYANTGGREPYPSYDQSGYRDDYHQDNAGAYSSATKQEKDQPFNVAALGVAARGSSLNMKRVRYEQDGIWTRGGGLRTCGRFFCCTILIAVWIFVGIVLALVLYVRPPNVIIGDAQLPSANQFQSVTGGLRINVQIPITVTNPSYLDITLPKIDAKIFYPINNTAIGNGTLKDTSLPAHSNKTFDFPFSLDYTTTIDPSNAIISDLLTKCASKSDLTVHYDLTVGVRVLGITVSPSVSNNISFACPIDASTIESLGSSLNISSIISGITGSG